MSIYCYFRNNGTPKEALLCNYFAAHNPITFEVLRIDNTITSSSDSSGNTECQLGADYPVSAAVDDLVYVESVSGVSSIYKIVALSSPDRVTINLPYDGLLGIANINFNDTLKGYFIRVTVSKMNWVSGLYEFLGTSKIHFSSDGRTVIDVSRFAKDSVNMIDGWFSETNLNLTDENISSEIKVEVSENYIDKDEIVIDQLYILGIVNAAMPIGHKWFDLTSGFWFMYGSCMAEFMPTPGSVDLALFLSTSRTKRYWQGLPFDLSFIYSNQINSITNLKKYEAVYNKSNTLIVGNLTPLNVGVDYIRRVNRLGVDGLTSAYPDGTDHVLITLNNDSATISETLRINISLCIPKNPVYLRGIDSTGGRIYWCFSAMQVRSLDVSTGGMFSSWYADISSQQSDTEILSKSIIPGLFIGCDFITTDEINLIENLLSCVKLEMLLNPLTWQDHTPSSQNPCDWQTVRVKAGSYKTQQTNHAMQSIEFIIELAEINIQGQ